MVLAWRVNLVITKYVPEYNVLTSISKDNLELIYFVLLNYNVVWYQMTLSLRIIVLNVEPVPRRVYAHY